MNDIRRYVAGLNVPTIIEITRDYHRLERDGSIGEGALRTHVKQMSVLLGENPGAHFFAWSRELNHECIRALVDKTYLDQIEA